MVLTAAGGNQFAAYFALAAKPTGAGMVVMPDVRGLHHFYKELAQRFAEAGVDAVAIDYFGRTAGIGDRGESFDYKPHVEKTTPEGISADVAAAVAHLRSKEGGAVNAVFTVGFCFGGSTSLVEHVRAGGRAQWLRRLLWPAGAVAAFSLKNEGAAASAHRRRRLHSNGSLP